MSDLKFPKYILCIPAVTLVLLIYPIGINTFLFTSGYSSYEVDAPGPAMQLNDISKGFFRDSPARPYPIFHSMITGAVYVPYIWAKTSRLPPYDIKKLDKDFPLLKEELIIVARLMNTTAAIGIVILSFYIVLLLCGSFLPPFLISLAVAMNPDLMFQSSVTYYENWSIFWVMLSALCFVKVFLGRKSVFFWFQGFLIIAALAISTHERMLGYFIFSAPFLIYRFCVYGAGNAAARRKAIYPALIALGIGAVVFCMANSVFVSGFGPIFEYIRFKSSAIKSSPDRVKGLLGLSLNQIRCHSHAIWLVFWNMGAILPLFSLYGAIAVWKKRFYPALSLLLFPLGYEIFSVGLPGWTSGRYILGQAIFASLFAGPGIAYLIRRAKNRNGAGLVLILFGAALISEFAILGIVKVAEFYYHPYRVVENVIKDPAARGKRITIEGIIDAKGDLPAGYGANCELLPAGTKGCYDADIVISTNETRSACGTVCKEVLRKPPAWVLFLVKRQCYLYSQGLSTIRVQWCENGKSYSR